MEFVSSLTTYEMSEFNESNCGPEGSPLSVRRYVYRKEDLPQIVDFERERFFHSIHPKRALRSRIYQDENSITSEFQDGAEYVTFSIDTATHARDFLDPNIESNRSTRTTFSQNESSLAVKMVLHKHEELTVALQSAMDEALGLMGLKRSIYHYNTTTFSVANGSKQPDAAWGPRRPPPGTPRRPTVVVETAISETDAKMLRDVGRWLDPIDGLAKAVLAIEADRWTPKITIRRWHYDSTNAIIENKQTIEIIKSNGGDEVIVNGGPLLIPFDLLLLRPADPPREHDIVIVNQELKEIARVVWEIQFSD